MQNQVSEIQSANSSEHKHQMFWDDLVENNFDLNKCRIYLGRNQLTASDLTKKCLNGIAILENTKKCSNGIAILENIAENDRFNIIEYLFERYDDIDIDVKYNEGNTLMHIAVKNGNFDMAKFLIEKGARIELINNLSEIPLSLCPPENNEIKKLLIKTSELDKNLHQAIKKNDEKEIRELLNGGARTNGGITDVESKTVTKGKVKIGKFVSNIELAIMRDSSKEIMDLLMNNLSKDGAVSVEKKIPNLLNKSIQHGSVNMVKYFLNDYDINYKYENEFNNNALQVAISNQFHFKTDDEKVRGEKIINLLIDKIIEKYPQHEEILSCENNKGFSARFMLERLDNLGKNLLTEIDAKIEGKRKEINQKEYEGKTIKLFQELEEGRSVSNPGCMTALCCCMNVDVERRDVDGNSQGVKADIVFEEKKSVPIIETKMPQHETPKEQQPIEVQAPSNINLMQEISGVSIDSPRDNTNSVGITLATTPAVTPYKPSEGMVMLRAMEASSTMSAL